MLANLLVAALLSNVAFAIPGVPNQFYGYAFINDQPAPDGTVITAKVNGVQVASTTTTGGRYGYETPAFYVDDPNNDRSGKAVTFFANGVDTGKTSYFCNACVTPLNLSASISPPPPPPQGGGGGAAPSGGGAVVTQVTQPKNSTQAQNTTPPAAPAPAPVETEQGPCTERWLCEDWSACTDGSQTRVCEDVNKCGTDDNKPLISQPCTSEQAAASLKSLSETAAAGTGKQPTTSTTGFAALAATMKEPRTIGVAGLLVAAVVLALVLRKKKN